MATEIAGKVLRALGTLAGAKDKVSNAASHYVRIRPLNDEAGEDDPEGHRDVLDVINDRVYLRVEMPGGVDSAVLVDKDTCSRVLPKDTVLISDNEIRVPFRVVLETPDGESSKRVTFPETDDVAPDDTMKAAFRISPKRLQQLAAAMVGLGCASVEVILPHHRGAPIGFRGEPQNDDRVTIRAAIQPDDMFTGKQGDEPKGGTPDPNSVLNLSGPAALPEPDEDDTPQLPFSGDEVRPVGGVVMDSDPTSVWYVLDSETETDAVILCQACRDEKRPDEGKVIPPEAEKCDECGTLWRPPVED